jgi:tetratricopeptide (TPR) repeat protein
MKPGARLALEGLITAALFRNNYDVAAYYGAQYVKAFPDSYEGWFNHGVALHKTGQTQEAANAYQEAIKIRPDGQEALANLAGILQEHDDVSRARQAYERVLELNPAHAGTLWNLGLLYQKSGNNADAEKCYSNLVTLEPGHEGARLRLGYLQLERGDYPGAIEALEKIAVKPRARSEAQVNLAIAYWRSEKFGAAKNLLQKALKDKPDKVEFLRVLAVIAVSEGNPDEAAKWEAKLSQLGERMPELSYNVGVLLQDAGKHDAAAKALERAVQGKPGFGEALLNLGHAFKALGQEDKAKECWREAIAAIPELAGGYFVPAPVS